MVRTIRTVADKLCLAEGPRWHDGRLYFSDVYCGKVYATDSEGHLDLVTEVPGKPSGLGWSLSGDLLIVSMDDRSLLAFDGDSVRVVADMSRETQGSLNDMAVDREGRAYIGGIGTDVTLRAPSEPAPIFMVRPDGSFTAVARGIEFANGMVIADGGSTLIVAETRGMRLTAFNRDEAGHLSGRRIFAQLKAGPDGICLDDAGAVWAAIPREERFIRVLPGGEISDVIEVPGRLAIACALGGPDGQTLFLTTTGRWQRSPDRMAAAIKARGARVEATEVEVPAALQ